MNLGPTSLLPFSNAALCLVTCLLTATGLLLELRMDEEDGAVRLFGMGRDDWGEIHFVLAIGFVALSVLHLFLNRAWLRAAVRKAKWALPAAAVSLGLAAALLLWPADSGASGGGWEIGDCREEND